jgi:hypothetical protein
MPDNLGPVYEVTHCVDRDVIDDFDAWLPGHVGDMLELPGISGATSYVTEDTADDRPRRVTAYQFDSEAELDAYLAESANRMREAANELFEGQVEISHRILRPSECANGELKPQESCLNCGTLLSGQYCGNCGQRARSRLISIWELTREAFGDLLELDSRLWRTLIPLFGRPGMLTRAYLEGRRASYMPPFRTYLVLSIFFFLIAFFDPREELEIFFEPDQDIAAEAPGDAPSRDAIRDEVLNELVEDGILSPDQVGLPPAESGATSDAGPALDSDQTEPLRITIGDNEVSGNPNCDNIEVGDMPEWMGSRLTPERLRLVCERVTADDGRAFFGKLLDNVPAGLFILLPLMALILKLLYPLSKRYYVEHLLFVVHYHAFVFLILSMQILFDRITSLAGLPASLANATTFAVFLYVPIYLYKGMRRVYEQRAAFTGLKFLVLSLAYFIGLSVILVFAALAAAFSI